MKKIIGFYISAMALCHIGFAQEKWGVGLKAGISIPELRAPNSGDASFSKGYKSVLGFVGGLIGEYRVSKSFSLQSEFNFSQQGGKKSGNQRIDTKSIAALLPPGSSIPPFLYANFTNWIKLEYLELPLMAKYSFVTGQNSRLSFMGGPYVGYLIKAYGKGEGVSQIYTDPAFTEEFKYNGTPIVGDFNREESIIDQINRVNYGVQAGATFGYSYNKYEFIFTAGGTYGLRRLQKDKDFGNNKTGGATVGLGVLRKI